MTEYYQEQLMNDMVPNPHGPWGCLGQLVAVILFILIVWLCGACRSTHETSLTDISEEYASYVEDEQREVDSLRQVISKFDSVATRHEQKDSSYHNTIVTDTTILHDSTFVRELSDGSRIEQYFHDKLRIVSVHDTLWKDRKVSDESSLVQYLSDSLSRLNEKYESYASEKDSTKTVIQYMDRLVTQSLPWYKKILMYMGGLLLIICLATLVIQSIKRKL